VLSTALLFYSSKKVAAPLSCKLIMPRKARHDQLIKNQKIEGGALRSLLFFGFGS